MFYCTKCGAEMEFDHTDYYDFDVYICPNPDCNHEISVPNDIYCDPDDPEYMDSEWYGDYDE